MNMDISDIKKKAAEYAVQFIESGMIVGLGHGSTAIFAVRRLADLLQNKELTDILAIPCSLHIEEEVRQLGIPLTTLDEHSHIDLTIDGADEVTEKLEVIKGGGGALLREKMVAQASRREIIVVDNTKLTPVLGTNWPVPIEVIPFGWRFQLHYLESLGAHPVLRKDIRGNKFTTDQGNYILDCYFGPIQQPEKISNMLNERAGIVEHGLFIGLATDVVIASEEEVRHIKAETVFPSET
jgi:ribose 5-phosphate isomerase A